MIKTIRLLKLLSLICGCMFVLTASADVDNNYIDKYFDNLQKIQDNKVVSCKSGHNNTLQLLKLIRNQSQNIKEAIRSNKCNLIAIDAVILHFEKQIEEIVSFEGSKTECEQNEQLKECQYAKKQLISVLNSFNGESYKKCLYTSLLESLDPESEGNEVSSSQEQININLLKDAMGFLENIDINNIEQEFDLIKDYVSIIEIQLIELIVVQIKNPEKFNPAKDNLCIQNFSVEISSLLDDIKFVEKCRIERNCYKSAMARFKSALISVQKMINSNDYTKCFSQYE